LATTLVPLHSATYITLFNVLPSSRPSFTSFGGIIQLPVAWLTWRLKALFWLSWRLNALFWLSWRLNAPVTPGLRGLLSFESLEKFEFPLAYFHGSNLLESFEFSLAYFDGSNLLESFELPLAYFDGSLAVS
jgi:hypothetical protein